MLRLTTEHAAIEAKISDYQTAAAGAVEEVQTVWTNKTGHGARRVAGLLEEGKNSLVEAAAGISDDRDWTDILQANRVEELLKAREGMLRTSLEALQQMLEM